ncbi:MAG TPA: TIM barrel protein [Gaiellales bacterium]|jgi:inosose dehydratase
MTPRIAAAPCSYGVFEITIGRPGLPEGAALVEAIADGGYAGTELGPPGYLGHGRDVGRLLDEHDLQLAGSFLPLRFTREDAFAEDLDELDGTLGLLTEASEGHERPVAVLSDGFDEPLRIRYAGAIEQHREAWLGERGQRLLIDNIHRAAERCRERGFTPTFHPHAGSYVESPREVHALLERMDASLLGLCFDTGHCAFGGGDPLALLREAGELVNHVHFKDVDLELLARLRTEGKDLEDAWEAGVFCELGTGQARVGDCLEQLLANGYDAWIVVEQDRVLAPGEPFDNALESAERNRNWLKERGL